MTNAEVCNLFISVLMDSPDLTMQQVALRLSATNYELRLLKADPLAPYEKQWERQHELDAANNRSLFPMETGARQMELWQVND